MKQFDRALLAQTLNEGIAALGLELSADQTEKLLDYLALLAKWNSVYNLTSVRDPQQMLTLHVLDSLAAVPAFAEAKNVLTWWWRRGLLCCCERGGGQAGSQQNGNKQGRWFHGVSAF